MVAVVVLCGFGALWAVGGLVALGSPAWAWAGPVVLGAGVAAWCLRAAGALPARSRAERRRIARLVGVWSAVEGALIVGVDNVLANTGRVRDVLPATAVIVGLHFLPLARGIPQPAYYATGAALVALGVVGLALADPYAWALAGFGSALVLWLASVGISVRRGGNTAAAE